LREAKRDCLRIAERELVTRCIGAGGAAWDPGGAEWRAAESAGYNGETPRVLSPHHPDVLC